VRRARSTFFTSSQQVETLPVEFLDHWLYLLRDRDAIFGDAFRGHVRDMGIQEVLCTPRSPWQRAYVERVIASIPRPCDRVPRKVATSYPSFVFGLLSPIENASLVGKGLARAEIDPAGANGESGGAAPGRRTASPLRTTGRLRDPALDARRRDPLRPRS
jgi:hypothetical protein